MHMADDDEELKQKVLREEEKKNQRVGSEAMPLTRKDKDAGRSADGTFDYGAAAESVREREGC